MAERQRRPYRQVARARSTERTRKALLDAADEEIAGDGFASASLESLASRAGVSKQTALRHFGSKQGLLDAVVSRAAEVGEQRDRAPIGDIAGAVAALVGHYERYGDTVTRLLPYRDAVVRVLGEGRRDSLARRVVDIGKEPHERWVRRTFAPQLEMLRGRAREQRLAQLTAVCDVYMWKLLRRDMGLSLERTEATLVELIERLVRPDAEATRPAAQVKSKRSPRGTDVGGA